jgi:hypothetical protein
MAQCSKSDCVALTARSHTLVCHVVCVYKRGGIHEPIYNGSYPCCPIIGLHTGSQPTRGQLRPGGACPSRKCVTRGYFQGRSGPPFSTC